MTIEPDTNKKKIQKHGETEALGPTKKLKKQTWKCVAKIRCWNKTHNGKWKWKLGSHRKGGKRHFDAGTRHRKNEMETGTENRRLLTWNPQLSTRCRTNRAIGRPRKRWEDDMNEFVKQEFEDTKDPIESNHQTNKTWISTAKDRGNWALLEEAYTMTVEERQEIWKKRENDQSRPAR